MTITELKAKRAAALDKAKAILEKSKAETRDLSDAERAEADGYLNDAELVAKSIARAEADAEREAKVTAGMRELEAVPARRIAAEPVVEYLREKALEDPARGFRRFAEFAQAVHAAYTPGAGLPDERLRIMAAASGMSQAVPAEGGMLVPPQYSTEIWDGMNAAADNLLSRTDNYTVDGESLTFVANAETSRATGSRYGGIRGYWINEADQITSSKPKVRQLKLEPQQLGVLVYVTDKLLANATALQQYLTRAAADEINFLVGDAIINGTGAGQPKGILASGALVSVAKEAGQAAATVVAENIIKMWARLHSKSRGGAEWYINQDIEPQLYTMSLAVGTGGVPVYMPAGGLSGLPYGTLFGRPVVPIEYCATVGSVGDVILADMKAYASGTKGGIESAMSIHLRFDYAETAFRFLFAVDGQTWLASAITPFKGSNTLSPYIALAVRS